MKQETGVINNAEREQQLGGFIKELLIWFLLLVAVAVVRRLGGEFV